MSPLQPWQALSLQLLRNTCRDGAQEARASSAAAARHASTPAAGTERQCGASYCHESYIKHFKLHIALSTQSPCCVQSPGPITPHHLLTRAESTDAIRKPPPPPGPGRHFVMLSFILTHLLLQHRWLPDSSGCVHHITSHHIASSTAFSRSAMHAHHSPHRCHQASSLPRGRSSQTSQMLQCKCSRCLCRHRPCTCWPCFHTRPRTRRSSVLRRETSSR